MKKCDTDDHVVVRNFWYERLRAPVSEYTLLAATAAYCVDKIH